MARRTSHLRLPRGLWRLCRARWYGARQLVRWDEIDVNTCLCLTTLLRQDWSPALVRQILGRPDYAILDLQGIRPPLRLYTRERVAQALSTSQFKRHVATLDAQDARAAGRLRRWSVQYQLEMALPVNATTQVSVARQGAAREVAQPPVPVASP